MTKFQDCVAVVTGAGSGIGKQLSIQLAKQGAQLAIADLNSENLAKTEQTLIALGAKVKPSVLDVSNRSAVFDFAKETRAHFGNVNLVINNAGVAMSSG